MCFVFQEVGVQVLMPSVRVAHRGCSRCPFAGQTSAVPGGGGQNQEAIHAACLPSNSLTKLFTWVPVDHVIPKAQGGKGDPSNGQVLCRDCNIEKSDKPR